MAAPFGIGKTMIVPNDPYGHIKADIRKTLDKEIEGVSKKRTAHWEVDDLYNRQHIISNETHEALHQWVEQEVK